MNQPNPYAPPPLDVESTGGAPGRRLAELRSVANYQKGILGCVVVYLLVICGQILLAASGFSPAVLAQMNRLFTVGYLGAWLVGFVFVILLSIRIYSRFSTALILAALTLLPCVGLLVLLAVNARATAYLTSSGIRVGLLGASQRDLERVGEKVDPDSP